MSEIVEYQLGSCLSLSENPPRKVDFDIFEVLSCLYMFVFRYETTDSFVV